MVMSLRKADTKAGQKQDACKANVQVDNPTEMKK